jgi:hypothetical protein
MSGMQEARALGEGHYSRPPSMSQDQVSQMTRMLAISRKGRTLPKTRRGGVSSRVSRGFPVGAGGTAALFAGGQG